MCTGFFSLEESETDVSPPTPPPPGGSLRSTGSRLLESPAPRNLTLPPAIPLPPLRTASYSSVRLFKVFRAYILAVFRLVLRTKSPFSSERLRETSLRKSRAAVLEGRTEAPAELLLRVPCCPARQRPLGVVCGSGSDTAAQPGDVHLLRFLNSQLTVELRPEGPHPSVRVSRGCSAPHYPGGFIVLPHVSLEWSGK